MTERTLITIREYTTQDLPKLTELWNEIVESGISFPQETPLSQEEAKDFFASQTLTACAFEKQDDGTEEMKGFYILHPNNVGRCSQIANASYGVTATDRGKGIGRKLVQNCLDEAKKHGFLGLQFNAVVSTNFGAIALYSDLGLDIMATIKNGFRMPDNTYTDTYIFFKSLV